MRDGEDFGIILLVRREGMNFQVAEIAREGEMLFGGDVLIAEEKDFPFQQKIADRAFRRRIEWLAKINATDLRADGRVSG